MYLDEHGCAVFSDDVNSKALLHYPSHLDR